MKTLDLTPLLNKRPGSRVSYLVVHCSGSYLGIKGRGPGAAIGFLRRFKNGEISTHKNGAARWYHADTNTLAKAVSYIRKNYGVSCPVSGWETLKIKLWSTSTPQEVVRALNKNQK